MPRILDHPSKQVANAMSKSFVIKLLILWVLFCISVGYNEFPECNCDEDEGWWSLESIVEWQKVSDFLIAVAYFSIPIELLYFISCSNVPFKWVIVEFIAFIVLSGMTHLLSGWTCGPHTFQLMLALTIFKFLTALVSFATAITLVTLIPMLLKVKVREFMLIRKTWDLCREVGIIKQQKETGWHVRMLTQEIRKSLDRHTILYTTLDKLSEILDLKNCVIWMPNESRTQMNLTHELGGNISTLDNISIPTRDTDVRHVKDNEGVKILDTHSALAMRSSRGQVEPGTVAAIRMPMLRVSDFEGGTHEMVRNCYAILVLVLPNGQYRSWGNQEIEIVNMVADQVTVALSHAALVEESQLVREKLAEQNRALQLAKEDAMMASQARNSFQMVMSDGMRRPVHSIMGLLSIMQDENLISEQSTLVDTMVETSNVFYALLKDVMDTSPKENTMFGFEIKPFNLQSMLKGVACLAKCLCVYGGFHFAIEVEKSLPDYVSGDKQRVLQVILHMFGNLLNGSNGRRCLTLKVVRESDSQGRNNQRWGISKPNSSNGYVYIIFEMKISNSVKLLDSCSDEIHPSKRIEEGSSFSICKRLVQMMQGNIWVVPNVLGFDQSMVLILPFQLRRIDLLGISEIGESPNSDSLFRGLQVLLADHDDVKLGITKRLLEKLGCVVYVVSSGSKCLSALGQGAFHIVLMDLHLPDLDGFEVAMRIHKFRSGNWPHIIALSENDDEDIQERCLQAGINGVIHKPILLQGIANEFQRVLMQVNKVL